MKEVMQTALAILGSVGVGGAIVAALSSWLGKVWAERLMAKEAAKYREELERLTKQLERKNYVSKVRFDAEFAIYRELCAASDEMVRSVYMLFPAGVDYLPPDEKAKQAIFEERHTRAKEAYITASKMLSKNSAFISKENYDQFDEIENLCRTQIRLYPHATRTDARKLDKTLEDECWARTTKISEKYEKLQGELRNFLKALEVL